MTKDSHSDFSIVQKYIELKAKYDKEILEHHQKNKAMDDKLRSHILTLENEVKKRNEYIKAQEGKFQELTQKITEKDEQLKTMGLQLHKLKMGVESKTQEVAAEPEQGGKKGGFGLFK